MAFFGLVGGKKRRRTAKEIRKKYDERRKLDLLEREERRKEKIRRDFQATFDRETERRQKANEKAREAARRAAERAQRLRDQADRARTATRRNELVSKAITQEKRVDRLDDIAARIERGQATPSEIRELMASGALRLRNPATRRKR